MWKFKNVQDRIVKKKNQNPFYKGKNDKNYGVFSLIEHIWFIIQWATVSELVWLYFADSRLKENLEYRFPSIERL